MSSFAVTVVAVVFAAGGLAFAGWGAAAWVRRRAAAGAAWRLGLGLVLLGGAGAVLWQHRLLLFGQDYQADAETLEQLARADLAGPAGADAAGEWPQWRGPRRDGVSAETGLLTAWPDGGPPVVWRQ